MYETCITYKRSNKIDLNILNARLHLHAINYLYSCFKAIFFVNTVNFERLPKLTPENLYFLSPKSIFFLGGGAVTDDPKCQVFQLNALRKK